jgi:hypothetical protein
VKLTFSINHILSEKFFFIYTNLRKFLHTLTGLNPVIKFKIMKNFEKGIYINIFYLIIKLNKYILSVKYGLNRPNYFKFFNFFNSLWKSPIEKNPNYILLEKFFPIYTNLRKIQSKINIGSNLYWMNIKYV